LSQTYTIIMKKKTTLALLQISIMSSS